jgi:hypothetical protein
MELNSLGKAIVRVVTGNQTKTAVKEDIVDSGIIREDYSKYPGCPSTPSGNNNINSSDAVVSIQ